ncbi:MAG: S8 family serine peptidase [Thermoanaerobaculia bacterium]
MPRNERKQRRARAPSATARWLLISLLCVLPAYSMVPFQATGADALPGMPAFPGTPPSQVSQIAPTPVKPACVPGQIIVKFKSSLTECAHCLLANHRAFAMALADGSVSLDELNRKNHVRGARNVFVDRENSTTAAAQAAQAHLRQDVARSFSRRSARAPVNSAVPDLTNIYVLEFPRDADVAAIAREYAADPHVEYAQPNYLIKVTFTPNDPYFNSSNSWGQRFDDLWALKKIGAPEAWDVTQGQGITVAVVDSGVDYTHPDIAENIVPGWNFVANTSDPMDDNGHGTHVAGTIAAIGNNGLGIVGVAPQARIMPLKGFDKTGLGSVDVLGAAIVYAAEHGADVINNSWACQNPGCASDPFVEDAVRVAYGFGVVTVFAAGNDHSNVLNYSPQNMIEAKPIVVAASNDSDYVQAFSNHGMTIDVSAPGAGHGVQTESLASILSLRSSVCDPSICDAALLVGDSYLRLAGTSMAAPHVSGAAALVLSNHPGFSNEEVRQVLRVSAHDLGGNDWDQGTGEGRIDVARAVAIGSVPTATITGPSLFASYDLSRSQPLEIRGTAAGPGFEHYQLFYSLPTEPYNWLPLAPPVASAVDNGTLGIFGVGGFPIGLYGLKLKCESTSGIKAEAFSQFAVEYGLQRISDPPAFDLFPAVEGNRVVWAHTSENPTRRFWQAGWFQAAGDIYLYDLRTRAQRRITNSGSAAYPAISGDRIVWQDFRSSVYGEIYMYDLASNTESPIAVGPGPFRSDPTISGDRIVWLQNDDLEHQAPMSIQLYDLATHTSRQITPASAKPLKTGLTGDLAISGNRIVWADTRNGFPGGKVFLYDLATATERQLTSGMTAVLAAPVGISGDRVVWLEQHPYGNADIVIYDLAIAATRKVPIVAPSPVFGVRPPYGPRISGDRVLWTDYRTDANDGNIYCYDLKTNTEQQITSQALNQSNARIYGNTAVWMDDREGSHIYLYEFSTGPRRPETRTIPFR